MPRLGLTLVVSLLIYGGVYRAEWLHPIGPLRNLMATLLALLPYLIAYTTTQALRRPTLRHWTMLWLGLIAMRCVIPFDPLFASDDAYRYLWDGLVQHNGINPYLHPPQAEALAHLRDKAFWPDIFRPDMRTVYPPLAELWFWLSYRCTPTSMAGLKGILLIHDCITTGLLICLLRRAEQPTLSAILYAWSPLAIVQLQGDAHLDGLSLPWLLLALLCAHKRPFVSGAALGAACMIRPLFVLCAPTVMLRRPTREGLAALLGFSAALFLLLVPYMRAGTAMLESLFVYAEHWAFNASGFRLLQILWGSGDPWLLRKLVYVAIALLSIALAQMPWSHATRFLAALCTYFVFSPTINPWYFLPLVAIGPLYRSLLVPLLPALITLSDLVYVYGRQGGSWQLPQAILWIEYCGIYGLLAYDLCRAAIGTGRK